MMQLLNKVASKQVWKCLLVVFAMAGYSMLGCAAAPAGGGGGDGAADDGAGDDGAGDDGAGDDGAGDDGTGGDGGGDGGGDDGGGDAGGSTAVGQVTFESNCMECHGADATGGTAPAIVGASDEAIQAAFALEGHPTFDDLTGDDVTELSAFLAALASDDGGAGDGGDGDGDTDPDGDGDGGGATREFAGAATCMPCHAATHTEWTETRHATAIDTLAAIGQAANAICLPCHTVGFDNGGFVSVEETPEYAGVQCENCHGAAAEHAANPGDLALRPPLNMAATLCGECHTDAHHPTFDEWQLSRHSTALATIQNHPFGNDECLQCHSQDYRHALEDAEEDEDIEVPTVETAQLSIECVTCHNPHAETGPPAQLRDDIANVCGECHTSGDALLGATPHHPQLDMVEGGGAFGADGSALAQAGPHSGLFTSGGAACAQCHVIMHEVEEPDDGNPNVTGHTFNPFDEDITELSPEHQAEEYNGCLMCHTAEAAAEKRTTVQAEITGRLEALAAFFDAESASFIDAEALGETDRASYDLAKFNYQFVDLDLSQGVHNSTYARAALDIAESILAAF